MTSLTNTAEITCEWNGEVCTLSSITPVTQPNETITVAGKPANYINTATSNPKLYMKRPYLSYVPTRMFYIFPNITEFAITSCSPKTTLMRDSFVNCASLLQLNFNFANISNIPEGFAQSCTNIKRLVFSYIGLETIDKNAFKGMINLEALYIFYTKLSCLPPDLFQTTPNIQQIIITNNKVSAIDSSSFRNLPKLKFIQMEDNLISYLPTFNLTGTSILYGPFESRFYGNPIYAIKPDFCNIFNSRPAQPVGYVDYFDITEIKCLQSTNQRVAIEKSNCQTMASRLQNCYSNWTLSMSVSVTCAPPSPWSSIWQQLLDFLNIKI